MHLSDEERERTRAWTERVGNKHPIDVDDDEALKDAIMFSPLDDDQKERIARWKHATLQERGDALIGLLRFVDKVGRFPEKKERFPGLPKKRPPAGP